MPEGTVMQNKRRRARGRVLVTAVGAATVICLLACPGVSGAVGWEAVASGSVAAGPSPEDVETLEQGDTLSVVVPADETLGAPASSAEV
ncbi:hypothetical protein ABT001_31775 [Streptomyces sp. NPDC002793]|uniref:hypothetical protein n=1 Tax=Streptomyces sp. NPDC002793 TaxID=3154432 RepID=UPI0033169851